MCFLSLILFMCCIMFIDLHMLNHPCIPGMRPTWSCGVWLNSVCKYFMKNICIYVHQKNWPLIFFFFLCLSCPYFVIRLLLLALWERSKVFFPFLFYGIVLGALVVNSSLKIW
jgi:hypothetical protein